MPGMPITPEPLMNRNLVDILQQASNLELYQLSMILRRLMSDPARILSVRMTLHIGQTVRYLNSQVSGIETAMRSGQVVAMKDTEVTLQDGQQLWRVPYVAIEIPAGNPVETMTKQAPTARAPGRQDFRVGDTVSFDDKHLRTRVGRIIRLNKKKGDTGLRRWLRMACELRSSAADD